MAKRLQDLTIKSVDENEKFVIVDTADSNKTKLVASSEVSKVWHTHTASDVTDFDTEVSNNTTVAANTAKISYNSTASDKLATIETSATADQTWAEIKSAYEAEADTNAYTDAEKTKLAWVGTPRFRTISNAFAIDDSVLTAYTVAHWCSSTPTCLMFSVQNDAGAYFSSGSRSDDGTTETQQVEYNWSIASGVVAYSNSWGSDYYRIVVDGVDGTNITFSWVKSWSWTAFNKNIVITCIF